MRRFIGRILEWFLMYPHTVRYEGDIPTQAYKHDAGFDLRVAKDIALRPRAVYEIPTDLRVDPEVPVWFEIKSRSSTFKKRNLQVQDAVIDNGFRGDLFAIGYNPNGHEVHLKKGERIAQIIPHRIIPITFKQDSLSKSDRGQGGFGSSGR